VKSLLAFENLAYAQLDSITGEIIGGFVAKCPKAGLGVSSINRELQELRRMFHLAQEWGRVEKTLPSVRMLPGEKHRERVLTAEEEHLYFRASGSKAMDQHADPRLLADVARILLDCGLRPEESFRLRPENVPGNARNPVRENGQCPAPHSDDANVQVIMEMRLSKSAGGK